MTKENANTTTETNKIKAIPTWLITIMTGIFFAVVGWSLSMLLTLSNDVSVIKSQLNEIPTKKEISVIQSQVPDIRHEINKLQEKTNLHDSRINLLEYKVK